MYGELCSLKPLEELELLAVFWSFLTHETDLPKIVAITVERKTFYKFLLKNESFRFSGEARSLCCFAVFLALVTRSC